MSHIFISYSRRDIDFAQQIVDALAANNLDIWVDWKSIPKGEDWEQEIYHGIEEAEAFLFLISPDSVTSEMCNKEIAHAVKNGKRILPIFVSKVEKKEVYAITEKFLNKEQRDEINRRNFIFCRAGMDDFNKAIEEIQTTIQTDYEWVEYHTRLLVKAVDWERKPDTSRLLRGKELREAEERFARVGSKIEPSPTKLQRLYLSGSKKHEKIVNRRIAIAGVVTLLVVVGSLIWPYLRRERAVPGNWVTIPAGKFTIGMDQKEAETAYSLCMEESNEEEKSNCSPVEELLTWSSRIENAKLPMFDIMDNEVTNAQYQQCINTVNCVPPVEWKYEKDGANKPATGLNWFQAGEYCSWLGGRLPTEFEWEIAASGPDDKNNYFPWGNTWNLSRANLRQSGVGEVQSIIQYADSDVSYYGIKNLAGNVREWTASESTPLDADQVIMNVPLSLEDNGEYFPVIVRGGAWISEPSLGMSSIRGTDGTIKSRDTLGFRCVCPASQTCNYPWNWRWVWFGKY